MKSTASPFQGLLYLETLPALRRGLPGMDLLHPRVQLVEGGLLLQQHHLLRRDGLKQRLLALLLVLPNGRPRLDQLSVDLLLLFTLRLEQLLQRPVLLNDGLPSQRVVCV